MDALERTQELLTSLEDLLVREFRVLQSIVTISKEERAILSRPDTSPLLPLVEEKEALLDELSQLEENRKSVSQSLAKDLGAASDLTSVSDILPFLQPDYADRLHRLGEGINTLVSQSRELNYGIQALATNRIDWVDAAQSFLISLVQPPAVYYQPGVTPSIDWTTTMDFDHKA